MVVCAKALQMAACTKRYLGAKEDKMMEQRSKRAQEVWAQEGFPKEGMNDDHERHAL